MSQSLPSVILRALEPEDLDELYAIENDTSIWDAGHTSVPYSRYALHDYIAHASADIYADRQVRLVIQAASSCSDSPATISPIIGLVDVMDYSPSHQRAELGLVVKKPFRGQGYGQAAVEAIIDYARRFWHLHQLYVIIAHDNVPALNLFTSMGFTHGGTLKSWLFDGKKYHDAHLMQTFL